VHPVESGVRQKPQAETELMCLKREAKGRVLSPGLCKRVQTVTSTDESSSFQG